MRAWDRDHAFKAIAHATWPEDYAKANAYQARGKADADRRMQRRYEGFRVVDLLQQRAREIRSLLEPVAQGGVRLAT